MPVYKIWAALCTYTCIELINIIIIIEEEEDGKLPFLDVLISKIVGGAFHTTTYRKSTNTWNM